MFNLFAAPHELGTERVDISKNISEARGDGINGIEISSNEIDGETTAGYESATESKLAELRYSNSPF